MALSLRAALLAALALALPVLAQAPAAPAPEVPPRGTAAPARAEAQALLARVDAEWAERDQPGRLDEAKRLLDQAEKLAPDDFGVLWREARYYFWVSDDPKISDEEKSKLGKRAWEYGDRASAADPSRVEGWYFAAVGMGNYSLGIGILKALGEGIEGKFRERLGRAEKIDPTFYQGGIYNAWGRFYYKLPWPKYDPKKSEAALQKAIEVNPANIRGRLFLAELYLREKHRKEAKGLLEEAVALKPGAYDAPEERRSQTAARELLAELSR
jgi:tetratricopeptide (TPR) repeat protein